MKLFENMQSTTELIEDVLDNRRKENAYSNIAGKNSIFFESFEKIKPHVMSYIIAKENFNFTLQPDTAANLRYLMGYSKNAFDNVKAVSPEKFRKKSYDFISSITSEWILFIRLENIKLLNGLNIIVPVHPTPFVVKKCIGDLKKCDEWPLTYETVDSYKNAQKQAVNLLKEIKFDDEIKDFLVKVNERRATLNDITPSVMEWIKSENIANKISLIIR